MVCPVLKLLQNYLSNRKQRAILNGSLTDFSTIESQGSVLGPLLFLTYVNDFEKNIKSNVKCFANHFAYQWKVEFNPDPSKQTTELIFSCKNPRPNHPPFFFNGTPVTNVKEHKHLGLILDSQLSFDKHANEKITNVKKGIGIIKHLSRFLPLKALDQMYKTLIRPHLDYCDIIYHIPPLNSPSTSGVTLSSLLEKAERTQCQAALAITGTWQSSSRTKLYEELGWASLSDRRCSRRILQIHKISNNITPVYLKEKLRLLRTPMYRITNQNNFHEINCKISKYKNSFFPSAVSIWSKMIADFQDIPSFSSIRAHTPSPIRPKIKNTFGIHDPLGLRYLFQLRVHLSPLNQHKKCHNFSTPSDICECKYGIEDTNHYLSECPLFTLQRATLEVNVIGIQQNNNLNNLANDPELYFYGHFSLHHIDNKRILLATIQYVKNTWRFLT